jgi:hypothetical protein
VESGACNPRYSRDRDQKGRGSKPAWARKFMRTYLKKILHQKKKKKRLVKWLKFKPKWLEFKPKYHKKKKKKVCVVCKDWL